MIGCGHLTMGAVKSKTLQKPALHFELLEQFSINVTHYKADLRAIVYCREL